MGNNRNGSRQRIAAICSSREISETEVYDRAKKLLESYRDVCWETSEYANLVREDLACEYGYASSDLDTALLYLENFAPDEQKEKFAVKIRALFSVKWMVEIVDSAIIKVREFPLNGELYAHILSAKKSSFSELLFFRAIPREAYRTKNVFRMHVND